MVSRGPLFAAGLLLISCSSSPSPPAAPEPCPAPDGGIADGYELDVGIGSCIPRFATLTVNGTELTLPPRSQSNHIVDLPAGTTEATVAATSGVAAMTVTIDGVSTGEVMLSRSPPMTWVRVGLRAGDGVFLRTVAVALRWAPYYEHRPLPEDISRDLGGAVAISGDGRVLVSSLPGVSFNSTCSSSAVSVFEPADGGFARKPLPVAPGCSGWSVATDEVGGLVAIGNVDSPQPVQVLTRDAGGWSPLTVDLPPGSSRQVVLMPDGSAAWAALDRPISHSDGGSGTQSTLHRLVWTGAAYEVTATLPAVPLQFAVSADESVVAIGTGTSVELYQPDAGGWAMTKVLAPPPAHTRHDFGSSVALSADGTVLVASARSTGVAYVYERTAPAEYALRSTLVPTPPWTPSNAVTAEIPVGITARGDRVVVGFPFGRTDPVIATRDGGTWNITEVFPPPPSFDYAPSAFCGNGVAISSQGDAVLIGCLFSIPSLALWRH